MISRRSRIARCSGRRCDQPAESHARRDGLAGGAEVGDHLAVEGGERGHRGDVVAELRVVVVLDDDRPGTARGVQQREPVGAGHHRPERVLVCRRDVRRRAPGEVGDRPRGREVAQLATDWLGSPRSPRGSPGPRARPGRAGGRRSTWVSPPIVPVVTRISSGSLVRPRVRARCPASSTRSSGSPARVVVRRGEGSPPRRHARPGARPRGAGGRSTACRCRAGAVPMCRVAAARAR